MTLILMSTNCGQLSVKHRVGKTFTGVPFDVAKSAIQKYIRRGNWEMTAKIIIDINQVRIVQQHPDEYAKFMNEQAVHGSDFKSKKYTIYSKGGLNKHKKSPFSDSLRRYFRS